MIPIRTRVCFITLLTAVLSSSAMYAQSQTSAPQVETLKKQLEALQAQMADLQAQINKLTAAAPATASALAAKEQTTTEIVTELNQQGEKQAEISKAIVSYDTTSQDQLAAPRMDNAPIDPRYPNYFRLPGTKTLLRIGGYFKTDFIYDGKPAGDPERFIPSSFPVPAPVNVNNSTVSIRPTRLNLDFLIPTEGAGNVRFFMEGDIWGSSSTTPRLRHAYAQVKNLLVGQTFSNFGDPDAGPDQLDFQGPNGQVDIRNPQIRYGFNLAKKTSLNFAVEKPSSDVAFKTPEFSALPNSPGPDGSVKLRHEMESGHVQFSAIFRSIAAYLPNGLSDSVFGWGLNFAGSQKLGRDTITYQIAYGYGIERYVNDTSGLGIDAAVISQRDPRLRPLPVVGTYGAYQHYWIPKLRSSVIYGFAQVQNTAYQPGSIFHHSNYSAVNLIWNAIGSLNLGAEFLYGWVVNKDNSSGNAPRLMFSAKYNFVKMAESK